MIISYLTITFILFAWNTINLTKRYKKIPNKSIAFDTVISFILTVFGFIAMINWLWRR